MKILTLDARDIKKHIPEVDKLKTQKYSAKKKLFPGTNALAIEGSTTINSNKRVKKINQVRSGNVNK